MKKSFEEFEKAAAKRQDKTLFDFREVLQNLIYLFRSSVNADTAYLYWINRSRQQFVKEAQSTNVKGAHFEDRVGFEHHFFDQYKDIKQPAKLQAGKDLREEAYGKNVENIKNGLLLIPFINNDETVALTALEWGRDAHDGDLTDIIPAYTATLGKLLNTYLEITRLYEAGQQWEAYDESLSFINQPGHPVALLDTMLQKLQSFLTDGSVSLVTQGPGGWNTVLNSADAYRPLAAGLSVEKNTVAADMLESKSDEFVVHFNGSPKRVSPREAHTEGATLAIPVIIDRKMVASVLIMDDNPLVFKESTKHKLKNIVRVTALEMQLRMQKSGEEQLLTNEYNAFMPDIWERVVDGELKRIKENRTPFYTWAGFATLSKLSELRTQLRAEELHHLQKDVVHALNPANFGVSGIVGFHTDYQYFILIQGQDQASLNRWREAVRDKFDDSFVLSNGRQIDSPVKSGFIELDESLEDSYEVVRRAKLAYNDENKEKEGSKIR